MLRILSICLVLLIQASNVHLAQAQTSEENQLIHWFQAHDRDHDGYLTMDEVIGYEIKLFKRMNSDGSGRLREDEYCGGIPPSNTAELSRCHNRFTHIDANGDGYITSDEVADFYRLVLQTADQNGDGKVSLEEWLASGLGD
jgi:Ca2+-binding EF-hand superfamily protein